MQFFYIILSLDNPQKKSESNVIPTKFTMLAYIATKKLQNFAFLANY